MSSAIIQLLARQEAEDAPVVCDGGNEYDGRMGARISSIFVILVCGSFGALFPVLCSKYSQIKVPPVFFFCAKYFGSGVIIATSLVHLLQPANEALSQPCLGQWNDYPYAFGICLFMVFFMFAVELVCFNMFGHQGHNHGPIGLAGMGVPDETTTASGAAAVKSGNLHRDNLNSNAIGTLDQSNVHMHADPNSNPNCCDTEDTLEKTELDDNYTKTRDIDNRTSDSNSHDLSLADDKEKRAQTGPVPLAALDPLAPKDHYGHCDEHVDPADVDLENSDMGLETYGAQLISIFVLEFGIIFHSVFIGLTLAVSGEEFKDLYIVLVFHQMFEGFGLGTRLATAPWPKNKVWTPWLLGLAFGLTTPIAIAIGLGVRKTYPPGGKTASITNGLFDSISSGILLYTGLVELMAHEFLFSSEFKHASPWRIFWAFAWMCAGAGLMALLGKWA